MLEVGKDSYITAEEADQYICKHYRTSDKKRKRWEETAEEDKEVLLRQACAFIEVLPYSGKAAVKGQLMAFPRIPIQYGRVDDGAPRNVKAAQIELALWLSDDIKQEEQAKRQELQAQGVEGFSIGDLSESYGTVGDKPTAILCPKVKALLKPYLSGSFSTC